MAELGLSAAPESKFEKEVRSRLAEIKETITNQTENNKESAAQVG